MTARQHYRSLTHTPELSVSDTEHSYSSDEEMPDRNETDQLLRQAHHYVITEGGKDSPTTYMERIQRINTDLVQEITTHGYDCDPKLFRRVRQKIDHVLREFEDAVDPDSSLYDGSDSPEYHAVAAEEGLYRMDSSPVTPGGPSARHTVKVGGKEDVERTYLYGGPNNHPESWYQKAPPLLPFPETIRMADWESLRIHWDLTNTGNMEKMEPVTGNAVSFDDPHLQHHNELDRYESGSRFKLPTPRSMDFAMIEELGTVNELRKAVDAFHQNDDTKVAGEDSDYKYAPRICLERLNVGPQLSASAELLDQVRSAVNTTPTKPHSSSSASHKIGAAPPATRPVLRPSQLSEPPSRVVEASYVTPVDDDMPVVIERPTRKATQTQAMATTSAMRRQRAKMEESLRSVDNLSSPPAKWETEVATHVAIPKTTRCRPRKNANPVTTTPAYQLTATGKRKRLSVNTEDDTEDIESQATISKRRQLAPNSAQPHTPTLSSQPDGLLTPATLPALTPGSSVISTPPVIKARAAGKRQRKIRTKRDFEQRVPHEKYDEIMAMRKSTAAATETIAGGSTRSGKVRKL